MARPTENVNRDTLEQIKAVHKTSRLQMKQFLKENIKAFNSLEQLAWLWAAQRPVGEIHRATTKARKEGFSWKEIAAAKGDNPSPVNAHKAMNAHKLWLKANSE